MKLHEVISAVRFDPTVPPWLIVALLALCLIPVALGLWRRARGAWLRLAAFAVLAIWLAGPRLVQETRQGLPDIALLVIDDTASMHIGDRIGLRDTARAKLEAEAAKLPDLQLRTITVPEAGQDGTRLFTAVGRALADIPSKRLAGVVAITDGQVHDIPDKKLTAPLHVLIPGKGEEVDRRLRIVDAPAYGIVGKGVTLRVAVDDLGASRGGRATLTIRRDGEKPVVEQVPTGRVESIPVPITRAGPVVIDLQASRLPGEVSTVNNRAVVPINGVRDRLRVLLISGEPNPGERTWRQLLKSDPAVDLVHFTILRPPEKDDMTPLNELALIAFPVRELFQEKIKGFDLIILDRFQNGGILPSIYLRNIADYVNEGGALLLSVGPEFVGPGSLADTPLGSVLPAQPEGQGGVVEGEFKPRITALGTRHPVTADLPGWRPDGAPGWGDWFRHIVPASTSGEVLMQGPDGAPLLVLNRVGNGRAAMLLSDQIWLWSRGFEGGGPQAELLRRTAHWLMKEPDLQENALEARIADGRLHITRRSLDAGPPPPATVTDPNGKREQVMLRPAGPGRADASLPAAAPGVWRVSDGKRTAYAAAAMTNPLEFADLRATATKLRHLVDASGGSIHWLDPVGAPALRRVSAEADTAGSGWIGLRRNDDHVVTGISAIPLLPPWAALPLLLGLVVGAWRREGR